MRTKKVLSLLLTMVLVASLAWGCSSDKGGSTDNGQTSGQTQNDTTGTNNNDSDKAVDNGNTAGDAEVNNSDVKGGDTDVNNASNVDNSSADNNDDKSSDSTDNNGGNNAATKSDVKGSLSVTTDIKNGCVEENGVYKITKGGIYTFTGEITNGQIYVEASDADEVEIELAGVTMSNDGDSCIFIENAGETTVSAKKGTVNTLTDSRAKKTSDEDTTGSGCIYSKDDLKISGKGELDVIANYNNGIACKNDIKIKNLTLKVSAPNNAIKGNDSITIESGALTVVSTEGDGLKTKNTDISSKGKQRGWIKIQGGTVDIYAADDCIKAAFDFKIESEATVTEKRYTE